MDQQDWNAQPQTPPQTPSPGGGPAPPPPGPIPQQGYAPPVSAAPVEGSVEARNLAMLCHLLGLVGFIGPLIIWIGERDRHKFVAEHGKNAMNYQVSILLYYVASVILAPMVIGVFMLIALVIMHVVFSIVAAVKANKGLPWKYPIAITFLK